MLDSINAASRRAQPYETTGEVSAPEAPEPRDPPAGQIDDPSDSWRSNLWFGLGAVAFVIPLFIPGIPRQVLFGIYLGIGAVLMIVPLVWALIRSARETLQARRVRRRGLV